MKLFIPIFLWSLATAATAQINAPVENALSPADQSTLAAARQLVRLEELWGKPLAWNETGASLPKIAADVRAQLGADAPAIEVRAATANRSTFALSKAPLGQTLSAIAELSNCRVWAFPAGLIIAPETALSDDERAAMKAKMGGAWENGASISRSSASWSGREQIKRVYLRAIGADVKAHLAAKGAPLVSVPPNRGFDSDKPTAPFEIAFGELLPESQTLLQELLDEQVKRFTPDTKPAPIAPEIVVGFDDTLPDSFRLFLRGTALQSYQTQWNVNK